MIDATAGHLRKIFQGKFAVWPFHESFALRNFVLYGTLYVLGTCTVYTDCIAGTVCTMNKQIYKECLVHVGKKVYLFEEKSSYLDYFTTMNTCART